MPSSLISVATSEHTRQTRHVRDARSRVEGQEADPTWKVGQWVSLALHREGQKWVWKGEKRAVLRGTLPFKDKEGKIGGA